MSDGAGSAQFSHFGARLVAERASIMIARELKKLLSLSNEKDRISNWLISGLQKELLELSKRGVQATSSDRARLALPSISEQPRITCDLKALSSTLVLVATLKDKYITFHIGDGVIGIENAYHGVRHEVRVASDPDNGEFANETHFVTSKDAAAHMRVSIGSLDHPVRPVTGFVLMSDGPEASLYYKPTHTLAPACVKLIAACRELPHEKMQPQLTSTLKNVIAKKTGDDCSLILMAR